jgi:uncharacterized protein YoxC
MTMLAMWFQGMDSFSDDNARLLTIVIVLVALAMVVQAIALIIFAVKSSKAIKRLADSMEDFKQRALPLIDSATEISRTTQSLLRENAPKVRAIADNLLAISERVRDSAESFGSTIADANLRTRRQVARIDGMVTATLSTTVEIVETIGNGIRVPALKIAAMTGQAKLLCEGLFAKIKSMAAGFNSGNR